MTNCYEYELVINYSVHVYVGFLRDDSDPDKNTESVRVDVVPNTAAGGGRVKPALDTALILLGTAAEGKASPVERKHCLSGSCIDKFNIQMFLLRVRFHLQWLKMRNKHVLGSFYVLFLFVKAKKLDRCECELFWVQNLQLGL